MQYAVHVRLLIYTYAILIGWTNKNMIKISYLCVYSHILSQVILYVVQFHWIPVFQRSLYSFCVSYWCSRSVPNCLIWFSSMTVDFQFQLILMLLHASGLVFIPPQVNQHFIVCSCHAACARHWIYMGMALSFLSINIIVFITPFHPIQFHFHFNPVDSLIFCISTKFTLFCLMRCNRVRFMFVVCNFILSFFICYINW